MAENNYINFDERISALNQEYETNGAAWNDERKRTYTVNEIQDILEVSRPTAYSIISSGVFKSVRVGNRIRVSKKSFDEWLDHQTSSGPANKKVKEDCA